MVLDNGLRLVSERRPGPGVVALELFVDAGLLREAKPGPRLPDRPVARGGDATVRRGQLAEAIEDIGGTLECGATGASLRVRGEDLPLALELLADVTLRPAFPAGAGALGCRGASRPSCRATATTRPFAPS